MVLLAAILPFLNTLNNGFHDDDEHAILHNQHLRSLSSIPGYFTDAGTFSGEPGRGMYRPLFQTTMALNYAAGGYDPRGYHLVSIGFHVLTCLGLLMVCRLFLSAPVACLVTVVFAVHPVHTQAINYLSSRSELMATCGVIWALWFAMSGRQILGVLLFALALLSKSIAIHLLPILGLVLWLQGRSLRKLLPYLGVAAAFILLISVEGFLPRSLAQNVRSPGSHLILQAEAIVLYLSLLVMPVRLSVEHGLSAASPMTPVASFLLILTLAGGSWRAMQGRVAQGGQIRHAGLGWLWFLAGLAVTAFVPLTVVASEQRLYLSTAGFVLALGAMAEPVADRLTGKRWVVAVAVGCLAILSVLRNELWENELTLWSDAVAKAPDVVRARGNVALALHNAGDRGQARVHYERALELDPEQPRIRTNYGQLLEEEGAWRAAEANYMAATRYRWSGARVQLGRLYLQRGRMDEARAQLDTALQINPYDVEAHHHLARWYQGRGDTSSARAEYEAALRIDHAFAPAANNLGLLLIDAGQVSRGRQLLQQASSADPLGEAPVNLAFLDLRARGIPASDAYRQLWQQYPQRPEVALALIRALARRQDWAGAASVAEEARSAHPTHAGLAVAAAEVHRSNTDLPAAIAAYEAACDLLPEDGALRNQLVAALAAAGRRKEALIQARIVLAQDPANEVARVNVDRLLRAP